MSAIDFPNTPTNGDTFTAEGNVFTYLNGVWSKSGEAGTQLTKFLLTAKGALISASAAGVPVTLPVGNVNGHGLRVDSTETSGLEWASMPAVTATTLDDIGDVSTSSPTAGSVLLWNGSSWISSTSLYAGTFTLNSITGNYTLLASDVDKLIVADSASTVTITVPPNSTASIAIGRYLNIVQVGVGQVHLAAGSGVTISGRSKLRAQYSSATLLKRAADSWVFMGDTAD